MRFDPLLVGNIFKEISNVGGYTAQGVGGAGLNAAGHRRLLKLCPHGLVSMRLAETVLAAVLAITKKLIVRARLMSANDPKRTSHHSRNELGMGFLFLEILVSNPYVSFCAMSRGFRLARAGETGRERSDSGGRQYLQDGVPRYPGGAALKSSRPMSAFEVRADMKI
jgi:hypothetical protein